MDSAVVCHQGHEVEGAGFQGHKRLLDINSFQVVTVTNSEVRAQNLTDLARTADDNKTGSELFLFGYEGDFSLDEPGKILGSIWKCHADERQHTLLE